MNLKDQPPIIKQIYPDSETDVDFLEVTAPRDLAKLIDDLRPVKRFNDPDYYPI